MQSRPVLDSIDFGGIHLHAMETNNIPQERDDCGVKHTFLQLGVGRGDVPEPTVHACDVQ